jgi:hypothetical protein
LKTLPGALFHRNLRAEKSKRKTRPLEVPRFSWWYFMGLSTESSQVVGLIVGRAYARDVSTTHFEHARAHSLQNEAISKRMVSAM